MVESLTISLLQIYRRHKSYCGPLWRFLYIFKWF